MADGWNDEVLEVDDDENIDQTSLDVDGKKYGMLDGDVAITKARDTVELQHQIWKFSLSDRLVLAPIPSPESGKVKEVIDLGCGTGAWALDFAAAYPSSHITGVDLKPFQPANVPANVSFLNAGVVTAEAWASKQYNLIHSRTIASGIKSWADLLDRANQHLQPGGWAEFQEYHLPMRCDDGSMAGTALEHWNDLLCEGSATMGVRLDGGFAEVPGLLQAKGFQQMGRKGLKWAVGPWPKDAKAKEIGRMFRADLSVVLEGVTTQGATE